MRSQYTSIHLYPLISFDELRMIGCHKAVRHNSTFVTGGNITRWNLQFIFAISGNLSGEMIHLSETVVESLCAAQHPRSGIHITDYDEFLSLGLITGSRPRVSSTKVMAVNTMSRPGGITHHQ